jgi:hypothetical protein
MRAHACILVVAAAAPFPSWAANAVIKSQYLDVRDLSRADQQDNRVHRRYDLCGMRAKARSHAATAAALEWDFVWSVVTDGRARIADVTASAFTRPTTAGARVASPAIAALAISLNGIAVTAEARTRATPRPDNAFVGDIPSGYAEQIFDALDAGTAMTVDVTYASGERETLVVRALGGNSSTSMRLNDLHGRNAPVYRCLENLVLPSGSAKRLVERPHDGS